MGCTVSTSVQIGDHTDKVTVIPRKPDSQYARKVLLLYPGVQVAYESL